MEYNIKNSSKILSNFEFNKLTDNYLFVKNIYNSIVNIQNELDSLALQMSGLKAELKCLDKIIDTTNSDLKIQFIIKKL